MELHGLPDEDTGVMQSTKTVYSEASERRQHPRFEVGMAVKISNGSRRLPSEVVDVSLGGVKTLWQDTLETASSAIDIGQFVELEIENAIFVDGFVVRVQDETVCVRFDVPDDDINRVANVLSDVSGVSLMPN